MSTVILVGAIPALVLAAVILGVLGWAIVTGNRDAARRVSRKRLQTGVSHPSQSRSTQRQPSLTPFRIAQVKSDPGRAWHARLQVHLAVAAIPVLAISAHVFTSVSLVTVSLAVLVPLLVVSAAFVLGRPHVSDRLLLAGFLWGLVACAGYDACRLPTIYLFHWWADFFGSVGGWATGTKSSFLVGYVWRYVGDGGGIAVAFFALMATIGASVWSRRATIACAVAYAVFPVWSGLVLTDLLAPRGHELFPLTLTTLALSLMGHLVYGAIMGFGYWKSHDLEVLWPVRIRTSPECRRIGLASGGIEFRRRRPAVTPNSA